MALRRQFLEPKLFVQLDRQKKVLMKANVFIPSRSLGGQVLLLSTPFDLSKLLWSSRPPDLGWDARGGGRD